jgi:hypothetical protein
MSDSSRLLARRWKLASTVTMAVIATAACGTTVPMSQVRGAAGSSGLTGGSSPGALQGGDQVPGGSGPGSLVSTAPNGQASRSVSSGGSSAGLGSSPGKGSAGPLGSSPGAGTARGPIKIGALTVQGAASYQRAAGFSHGASGDQLAMMKSVVSYINAHGGLGGRKIELFDYDLNPASYAADPSSAMQAACTYFTQDTKVVAVASDVALVPDTFYQCLANAHVPVVTPDESVSSDFFHRYASTVYMPAVPSYTRLLSDSVDALWNAGWLTAKSIVGVVSVDTVDAHAAVDKGLAGALKRHGLKITAGMYTSTTDSQASEYNGGVLSFNTNHVDRVFFGPGGQPIYFGLAAEQQHYHPRYEVGSLEYPAPIAATLPADQLSGSMGLAWLPYLDLASDKWPTVSTPGIAECRKAMASANQDFSTGTTLGIAAWICDDWMFLRDVFAAGASPDEASIRRAAESLGETFKPAATFQTSFSVGRTHDGAALYRLIAFQDTCSCYSYTSPARPLP